MTQEEIIKRLQKMRDYVYFERRFYIDKEIKLIIREIEKGAEQ